MTSTAAVRAHAYGPPEAMQYDEKVELKSLGENDLLVQIDAAGVNFIDTYQRAGSPESYQLPLPVQLGREGAGTVLETGAKVKDFKVGDAVCFFVQGTYANTVVVPAKAANPIPSGVSTKLAAAVLLQGLTAHYLLTDSFPVKKGDWTLIHAGAGGCGGLMIQIAKLKGAHVITTVSTEEKAKIAKEAGADHVILYSQVDFLEEVQRITGGEGVHVVYDGVGKATYEKSAQCLRKRGFLVLFGNASGPVPPIDPLQLTKWGSIFMTRPTLKDYVSDKAEKAKRLSDLFGWVKAGQLKVRVAKEFPLKDAPEAHRTLQSRKALGKILLVPERS